MKNLILASAIALATTPVMTIAAHADRLSPLRQQFFNAEGYCRGSTNPAEIAAGCSRREAISKQLESLGQCYARVRNETGGESVWRPCWPPRDAMR